MNVDFLFDAANLFVLPFWALIVFLPNWSGTRRVMQSYIPFAVLALLYLYLLAGTLDADAAKSLANPRLADIARLLGEERAAAAGWTHFLIMDLFVGRWVYLEGQRSGVWTVHSLVLCLVAGPLGLLSHIITAAVSQRFFAPSPPAEAIEQG